ncbi:MAG TPA: hypothetical protein VL330_06525, partial [Actinomycetes bacterium]|nr:hypothetical protein [Actinomycetes bacterium]
LAADKVSWALGNVPSLAFVTVGAVIVARRPGNRIGWLCYGVGLGQILASFASQTAASVLAAGPRPGPVRLVAYELGELWWELSWALLAMLLLLFPNGQLPSPRWRPVAWAGGAVLILAALSAPFLPEPPAPGLPPNPIAIPALEGVLRLAYASAGVALAGMILAALVSLIVRFRRARGVERQQLKWFAYGTALLLFLPAAGISGASLPAPAIAAAIPVSIGLAVLRYRLYDIDRLINRTLVYGLLTALLGLGYVAGSLLFVQVAGAGSDPPSWLVAAATLAAAAVSARPGAASSSWSTGASTAAGMTPPALWKRSAPASATRST